MRKSPNKNYKLIGKSVSEVLSEYRISCSEKFQKSYNIIFNKDGTVFDKHTKLCYSTLQSWVKEASQIKGDLS